MNSLATFESKITEALRSRTARLIGLVAGTAAVALMTVSLIRSTGSGKEALAKLSPSSALGALAGFGFFQASAVVSLRLVGGKPAASIWASAQLAKYFPAPGAALAGMVRASVLRGSTAAHAVRLTARHMGVLLGGASIVAAPAAGRYASEGLGISAWAGSAFALALAILFVEVGARSIRPRDRRAAAAVAAAGWTMLGLSLAGALAPGHDLTVASAFPAAWVIGLLALPVPAGLGVRESVLFVLLEPSLGSAPALAFGVVSRLMHVASDGFVSLLLLVPRFRS